MDKFIKPLAIIGGIIIFITIFNYTINFINK